MRVSVLGEQFDPDGDTEDSSVAIVEKICIGEGRYYIEVPSLTPGNWCMIEGVDSTIFKSATITNIEDEREGINDIEYRKGIVSGVNSDEDEQEEDNELNADDEDEEEDNDEIIMNGRGQKIKRNKNKSIYQSSSTSTQQQLIPLPPLRTQPITSVHSLPHIFTPLQFFNMTPSIKISVEPLHPRDLPKMVEGLRSLNKTYPILQTKIEESGEHVIWGTGELQLDCAMYDLREVFAKAEVKVSDPYVPLNESVAEKSILPCSAETANKIGSFAVIA
ncbi:MAG: putative U5 small nuclear ribonuclear protein, partial [Streblomastix strix]